MFRRVSYARLILLSLSPASGLNIETTSPLPVILMYSVVSSPLHEIHGRILFGGYYGVYSGTMLDVVLVSGT